MGEILAKKNLTPLGKFLLQLKDSFEKIQDIPTEFANNAVQQISGMKNLIYMNPLMTALSIVFVKNFQPINSDKIEKFSKIYKNLVLDEEEQDQRFKEDLIRYSYKLLTYYSVST